MAEIISEKYAAQEEANQRTDWERQRIEYYYSLRYGFSPCSVGDWLNTLFDHQKVVLKEQQAPSWNQMRKEAGIVFWENAFASREKKKIIDVKKAAARKKLQAEVDRVNAAERERCRAHNSRLHGRLEAKLGRLTSHDAEAVEQYFTYVLNLDFFSLDGNEYQKNFSLLYDPITRQLIVDYNLPTMDQISQVKEWKVDKNNEVVPKQLSKTEYLEMYERIIFDLSIRAVGMLFKSDPNKLLRSVIFNGFCIYSNWQKVPTILISFEIRHDQYSYDKVRKMDFVSKSEIAKLKNARYLDNIESLKTSVYLWETPPSKLVVPIRSSF